MDGAQGAHTMIAGIPLRWVAAAGGLVLAAGVIGWQSVRLDRCRADLAEHRAAYLLLADRVQQQAAAVEDLERQAAAAKRAGAQARAMAARVSAHANARADALALAVAAPAAPEAGCNDALAVVRQDLNQ